MAISCLRTVGVNVRLGSLLVFTAAAAGGAPSPQSLLDQALHFADLYNWYAARPLFEQARREFEAAGDNRNALYARWGAIRAGAEPAPITELSYRLGRELANRLEVTSGPGSGVKILNQPVPPAFRERVRIGEQNLYTRAKELVGDRDPREHEFSIQMRAIDADRSGAGLGLPVLEALCGALLGKNTRGGTIVVGALNLGGSIDLMPNAVQIAELAIDKQAQTVLMPVAARRQLNDLPDDLWTRISIEFYKDAADAVFKALVE
jgi:hypothetical protein